MWCRFGVVELFEQLMLCLFCRRCDDWFLWLAVVVVFIVDQFFFGENKGQLFAV